MVLKDTSHKYTIVYNFDFSVLYRLFENIMNKKIGNKLLHAGRW